MGTDTGGSIRNPAACCGVVGFKPTYGVVSRYGVIPNSYTFDHCGPLAWTTEDCAILMQAIAGFDARDGGSVRCDIPDYRAALTPDLPGLRVGVIRHFWEEDLAVGIDEGAALHVAGRTVDVDGDAGLCLRPITCDHHRRQAVEPVGAVIEVERPPA